MMNMIAAFHFLIFHYYHACNPSLDFPCYMQL
jgi:hypothetical protein